MVQCNVKLEPQGITMLYVFKRGGGVQIAWNGTVPSATAAQTSSLTQANEHTRAKGPLSLIAAGRSV